MSKDELSNPPDKVKANGTSDLKCKFRLFLKFSANSSGRNFLFLEIFNFQYLMILMDFFSIIPKLPAGREYIFLKNVLVSSSHQPLTKYFVTVFSFSIKLFFKCKISFISEDIIKPSLNLE